MHCSQSLSLTKHCKMSGMWFHAHKINLLFSELCRLGDRTCTEIQWMSFTIFAELQSTSWNLHSNISILWPVYLLFFHHYWMNVYLLLVNKSWKNMPNMYHTNCAICKSQMKLNLKGLKITEHLNNRILLIIWYNFSIEQNIPRGIKQNEELFGVGSGIHAMGSKQFMKFVPISRIVPTQDDHEQSMKCTLCHHVCSISWSSLSMYFSVTEAIFSYSNSAATAQDINSRMLRSSESPNTYPFAWSTMRITLNMLSLSCARKEIKCIKLNQITDHFVNLLVFARWLVGM